MSNSLAHADGATNQQLLMLLLDLPTRIVNHYDVDGLVQMVLHELSHEEHLGLKRATYLVESPDFDCVKGVAGYCKDECKFHKKDLWSQPRTFSDDMKEAQFHQTMQRLLQTSFRKKRLDDGHLDEVRDFGYELGMQDPNVLMFNLKHGNHGILIFEPADQEAFVKQQELLNKTGALLGLCHA